MYEQAKKRFNIDFPLLNKVHVNGKDEDPLYAYLKSKAGGGNVKWNYEMFLIGSPLLDGATEVTVQRYRSKVNPLAIENDIAALLQQQ